MSSSYSILQPAVLEFTAQGTPKSVLYQDVYHAAAGAIEQAQHVFLAGNQLPQRWRARASFTICETGFGLGHNFLATWQAWSSDAHACGKLFYLAFEAHPLERAGLRELWRGLAPQYQPLAGELAAAWPELLPGVHRIELAGGRLVLTLIFGAIERTARQAQCAADAFYLDGFAPKANPAMWSPRLFGQLRRLAAPGATLASWCAAGQVRRDLEHAGFIVERHPGFAAKREMIQARLRAAIPTNLALQKLPPAVRLGAGAQREITIIGAGIAGAACAFALARRGARVRIIDPECALDLAPEWRARGAAALIPALSPDDDSRARLSRVGLQFARVHWSRLPGMAAPQECGALLAATNAAHAKDLQRCLERLGFPAGYARWLDGAAATDLSGVPLAWGGIFLAQALRICPGELIAALLQQPGIERIRAAAHGLQRGASGQWRVLDAAGRCLSQTPELIIAAARHSPWLLAQAAGAGAQELLRGLPVVQNIKALPGEVGIYPCPPAASGVPKIILSGHGYLLPPANSWAVAGSTYEKNSAVVPVDGQRQILEKLASWLDLRHIDWFSLHNKPESFRGVRAATRDHLPIIGALPQLPGIWLACAFGSRGCSWAPMAAELIASALYHEPAPLERELIGRIAVR